MVGSTETINLATLLAPITGAQTGVDLRIDVSPSSIYYKIKDARNLARTIERQQTQGSTNQGPNEAWQKVIVLATEILSTQSKDLEICVWFIEALLRCYNFAGLRDGFKLAHGLCDQYWDQLYPTVDENDLFSKVAAFSGLNGEESEGTLIAAIANVSLTEGKTAGPFAQWNYQQATEISYITDPDKQAKRIASGATAMKDIQIAIAETSPEFFHTLFADLQNSIEAYDQLISFLDEKCGKDSPPSSRIRAALLECEETIKFLAGASLSTPAFNQAEQTKFISSQANEYRSLKSNGMTREKAFETLLNIANYFKETEPHSPLSYLILKTIHWGKLSLPQLFEELIKDDNARKQLFTLTGMEATSKL